MNFMNTPKSIFSYFLCLSLLISLVLHAFGQDDSSVVLERKASFKTSMDESKKEIIGNNKQASGGMYTFEKIFVGLVIIFGIFIVASSINKEIDEKENLLQIIINIVEQLKNK